MAQPNSVVIPISYSIFEDEDGIRYLSPDVRLLNYKFPKKTFNVLNSIKTAKTVSFLVGHKNSGNNLDIIDISAETGSINSVLDSYGNNTIKTENNVNHLLSLPSSTNKINQQIASKPAINTIKDKLGSLSGLSNVVTLEPLPYNVSCADRNKENKLLQQHLNYYLKELGLKTIKNISSYKVYDLSSLGDKMLFIDLTLNYGLRGQFEELNVLNSNRIQQFIMASLGFVEFLYAPEHLSGTFLETIYAIAKKQEQEELNSRILKIMTNHLKNTKPFSYPEFE